MNIPHPIVPAGLVTPLLAAMLYATSFTPVSAQQPDTSPLRAPLPQALSDADFTQVTQAVDRALTWISTQQEFDGCLHTDRKISGQPAVTALGVMAFLSRGHRPGVGPYGTTLDQAIDFTISCQSENGFIGYRKEGLTQLGSPFSGRSQDWEAKVADTYNHAISLLMLGEVYGLTTGERSGRVQQAISKGIEFTRFLWTIREKRPEDQGGWRYLQPWNDGTDSDLSVTGWHALSLRSVKNAGFDVPKNVMDQVSTYVLRLYSESTHSFTYKVGGVRPPSICIAMTGAGILCLALGGQHQHPAVLAGIHTIAQRDFEDPRTFLSGNRSWPYYTCYYASQAAAQVGGDSWVTIYRKIANYLLSRQRQNGTWLPSGFDAPVGPTYSTAMAVLALTPQFQLLPIYQH